MIHYTNIIDDQYVPGDLFPADIKMEEDESYYRNFQSLINDHGDGVPKMMQFLESPQPNSNTNAMHYIGRNDYSTVSTDDSFSPLSSEDSENCVIDKSSSFPQVKSIKTVSTKGTRKTGGGVRKTRNSRKKNETDFPKEKDRAKLFNNAFDNLRTRIPSIPASKKLSKIEILRLAICYMSYLKFLLELDLPSRSSTEKSDIEKLLSVTACEISRENISNDVIVLSEGNAKD